MPLQAPNPTGGGGTSPTTSPVSGAPIVLHQPVQVQPVVTSTPATPVTVQPTIPAGATISPTAVAAAQAWLAKLIASYNAALAALANLQTNAADSSSWNADAANLGITASTLQAAGSDADTVDTVKTGQSDLLTAVVLVGQIDQATSLVTDPHAGLAALDIPQQAAALSTLLGQLSGAQVIPPGTTVKGQVKTTTAVVSTVGGLAVGGVVGGLLGHAIASGAVFAGETMAAESRRRKKKWRRR